MNYCDPNVTILTVWYDHGFSHCFLDTLASGILLLYMLTFGIGELVMYKRHGTPIDNRLLKSKNFLYQLQRFLHYVRILSPVLWLVLHDFDVIGPLYGHLVLKNLAEMVVWIFSLVLISVERNYDLPTPPAQGHGVVVVLFWALEFVVENLSVVSFNGSLWWWKLHNHQDQIKLAIYCVGYVCLLALFFIGLKAPGLPTLEQRYQFHYRTLEDVEAGTAGNQQTSASQGSTFRNLWRKLTTLLPYMWPKHSFKLQLCVLTSIALLVCGRFVNLYVPLYNKKIVDSLSTPDEKTQKLVYHWDFILIYVTLLLAQGGAMSGGLLSVIRGFLWIRVQQYTTREIQVHFYEHLHNLSLRWHLSRKTGEVLRVMDRGTNSINQLLSYILFNIAPTIIDITIAVVYFTTYFNIYFGLIVFTTMALYAASTFYLTEWRTKYRRAMNRLDNETETKAVDALLNFETVKYYNAEEYEVNRYRDALLKYQAAEWLSMASMSLLNFIQNFIITGGLLAGSMLCAWFVVQHMNDFTVGSYVLFASYIMQLYGPLNWLGTYYRMIQQSFVDMENMLDLLNQNQEVKDDPNAKVLDVKKGRIEFKNVNFHYMPEKPILKNISFVVEPGKSVALVGPSGSGKSTVMRLLFRFYDINSGQITIDDQDIARVTQKSLRKHIGVVPQDTVLFNDTIKYNIRYGNVLANDDEIFAAAQAAEIHDKILSFPDGYDSMVGERGLKLSGGEKQRVAIARTILKAPNFVLLDEATSALDTNTERLIQASLDKICVGKTSILIAHRLSTIVDADEILVLINGEIVERGSHDELLEKNGSYASMWKLQLEKSSMTKSASSSSLRKLAASNAASLKASASANTLDV